VAQVSGVARSMPHDDDRGMKPALFGACALVLHSLSQALPQQGGVQVLSPPPTYRYPYVAGMSGDGGVVVGRMMSVLANQERAFRWTEATGFEDLGVLVGNPAPGGGPFSRAAAVDRSGEIVVGELRRVDQLNGEAFVWTRQNGYRVLPTLPGGGRSVALDVSADGAIVVGWSERAHPLRPAAVVWNSVAGTVVLPPLSYPGSFSAANAVSADGSFVVGISNDRAFRWSSAAGIEDLALLPGTSQSHALAVNADGSVVVGTSGNQGAGYHGCIWTSGMVMSLGAGYQPFAVSDAGDVVVGEGPAGGFVWTSQSGVRGIDSVVASRGYNLPPQYVLDTPLAVDVDGGWISGIGSDFTPNTGGFIAWRLNLEAVGGTYCSPGVPNQTGASARIRASGSATTSTNALVLHADRLPLNSFLFFLTSRNTALIPHPPNSVGVLCLGGAIGRYVGPGQIHPTGASGAVELALDLAATPTPMGLVPVAAGETWHFQGWYRDNVLGQLTSNFTDAVSVTFN